MDSKPPEPHLQAVNSMGGCFWVVIVGMACVTIMHLAELWFQHR